MTQENKSFFATDLHRLNKIDKVKAQVSKGTGKGKDFFSAYTFTSTCFIKVSESLWLKF